MIMAKDVITIIGSTGTIGHEILSLLSAERIPLRAVLRDFRRARKLAGVVWVQADVGDPSLPDVLLAGTDRLFLLSGNNHGFGKVQIGVIRAAERQGVTQVVKLSALGASPHTKSPLAMEHWEAEKALEGSSMSWTILRPHAFMQNWLGEVADTVRN